MQGNKTHEQLTRTLERKPDMPDARRVEAESGEDTGAGLPRETHPEARQSEFAVSVQGAAQESDHNKHNNGGQAGHKPQKHSAAEEKH
jgi:hypothetical protein